MIRSGICQHSEILTKIGTITNYLSKFTSSLGVV